MKDLKFEQKRSLSRLEAADQLTALATALREGGEAELELGSGTLSLRVPDDLRGEMEVEIGHGEIELEIEFKWPMTPARTARTGTARTGTDRAGTAKARTAKARAAQTGTASSGTAAGADSTARRGKAPAKAARSGTSTSGSGGKSAKRSTSRTSSGAA